MTAIQILQDLHYKTTKENYKNVPAFAIPKKKFSDTTSNGLTNCILTWFQLNNHWATRINTTGRFLQGKTFVDVIDRNRSLPGSWIPGTTKKGTADIHSVIHGIHCSIEVKIGADRLSADQIKTKESIEKSGGLYFVAKDFESFLKFYHQITDSQ